MPKKVLKNRKKKTYNAIVRFLRERGEAATPEILEYLNDKQRSGLTHGCTTPRLSNMLGKMIEFEDRGTVYLPSRYYHVKVWGLADWV